MGALTLTPPERQRRRALEAAALNRGIGTLGLTLDELETVIVAIDDRDELEACHDNRARLRRARLKLEAELGRRLDQ